jgi:serine/threonine protein kinase
VEQGLTQGDRRPAARVATLFASPAAVLVILPALVISAGVVVLLLGRRATHDTAETMARQQMIAQANAVRDDVSFALEQADPVLAMMRSIADTAMPTPDAISRLRDIVYKRPGIANASIAFPVGVLWGTYRNRATGELQVFDSRIGETETQRTNYAIREGKLITIENLVEQYDPRTRPHYTVAAEAKKRVWMPPRVLSNSGKPAMTVSEPVFTADGQLAAVMTIDFEVAELSEFISKSPLANARNVMFTSDGTILAYPSAKIPDEAATRERRLLRYQDFHDPALDSLFKTMGTASTSQRFMHLDATDDKYLAAITSISTGKGGETPNDWYLATLVPERTLFGTTQRLGRDAIIASGSALLIAMGVALMFAWNILRMRRAVGAARAQARNAEERAKQMGSYKLVARLGAGGMGEVWRAEHQLLARKAAIKLVRPDVLRNNLAHAPLIQERFRREAQTLASMRSRHTIELYDYGVTDDGTFFYVMELLDGLDLSQLVRGYGPQSAARVISIIGQACQSLAEAHSAGLLHRDIKPANLVLCRAADEVDILKVLDFGIVHNVTDPIVETPITAKAEPTKPGRDHSGERLTTEGSVIGTPGYIPPEQATAAPLDARGDLYALGCVAWYLLVGDEVYPGLDSEDAVLRAHVFDPIPSLRHKMRGWLPVELEQLITKCLAKRPEERPEDARALAKALAAIEIPAEHQWTDTHAQMWWASLELPKQKSSSDAATVANGEERVIVSNRATEAPSSNTDARTIEARPSARTL